MASSDNSNNNSNMSSSDNKGSKGGRPGSQDSRRPGSQENAAAVPNTVPTGFVAYNSHLIGQRKAKARNDQEDTVENAMKNPELTVRKVGSKKNPYYVIADKKYTTLKAKKREGERKKRGLDAAEDMNKHFKDAHGVDSNYYVQ